MNYLFVSLRWNKQLHLLFYAVVILPPVGPPLALHEHERAPFGREDSIVFIHFERMGAPQRGDIAVFAAVTAGAWSDATCNEGLAEHTTP